MPGTPLYIADTALGDGAASAIPAVKADDLASIEVSFNGFRLVEKKFQSGKRDVRLKDRRILSGVIEHSHLGRPPIAERRTGRRSWLLLTSYLSPILQIVLFTT